MTKLFGVIGDPIAHSLSAVMHNRAFKHAAIDAVYLPFHVPPAELASFIDSARHWPCSGFNVTIPHKQSIMDYIQDVSEEARLIGAVNTVTNSSGRLMGTNTDAVGYVRSLREDGHFDPSACTAVILGAGGAAHAVCYSLLEANAAKIILCNRTELHARSLAQHFAPYYPHRIEVIKWERASLMDAFGRSQLLINATSVGLHGTRFDGLPLEALPQKSLVSDLVYRPRQTPLLRAAASLGLRTLEGLAMLVYQGAASFEIWTGVVPDIGVMRMAVTDALAKVSQPGN